jgi:hypothetical protein
MVDPVASFFLVVKARISYIGAMDMMKKKILLVFLLLSIILAIQQAATIVSSYLAFNQLKDVSGTADNAPESNSSGQLSRGGDGLTPGDSPADVTKTSTTQPVLISSYPEGVAERVVSCGSRVYATFGDTLKVFEVNLSSEPKLLKEIPFAGYEYGGGTTAQQPLGCNAQGAFIAKMGEGFYTVEGATFNVLKVKEPTESLGARDDLLFTYNRPNVTAYDLANISNPIKLGSFDIGYTDGDDYSIFTKSESPYLFLHGGRSVKVFKINSNPLSLTPAGTINLTEGKAPSIDYRDNILFVAEWPPHTIHIFSMASGSPKKVGEWISPDAVDAGTNVHVYKDKYIIVSQHDQWIELVDVSDPSSPKRLSKFDYRAYGRVGYPDDSAEAGNYAALANQYAGLMFVDWKDTRNPAFVKVFDTMGRIFDAEYRDGLVYAVDDGGFEIFDFRVNPANVLSYDYYRGRGNTVLLDGPIAYASGTWAGFRAYDVSNPDNAVLLSTIRNERAEINRLAKRGDVLYAAEGKAIGVYDVADPGKIAQERMVSLPNVVMDLAVSGLRLYATCGYYGGSDEYLIVFDISSPKNPVELGRTSVSGTAQNILIDGHYAYVTSYKNGVNIYDVSGNTPVKVGTYACNYPGRIFKQGEYVYLGVSPDTLEKLDVSNHTNPKKVESIRGLVWDGESTDGKGPNFRIYPDRIISFGAYGGRSTKLYELPG